MRGPSGSPTSAQDTADRPTVKSVLIPRRWGRQSPRRKVRGRDAAVTTYFFFAPAFFAVDFDAFAAVFAVCADLRGAGAVTFDG
jgi:hypothetical protein